MTTRRSTNLPRLLLATRLAAAGAIAAGAMMLTAPAGNAIPESTIRSDCDNANNGTYTTTISDADGKRYSKCCYRDISGVKHCDNYVDGTYTNTTVNFLEPPQPSPPPPPPGGGVVGPPATAAERPPVPPVPPDFGMATLYMPPPPGPAAPPPNEATRAP